MWILPWTRSSLCDGGVPVRLANPCARLGVERSGSEAFSWVRGDVTARADRISPGTADACRRPDSRTARGAGPPLVASWLGRSRRADAVPGRPARLWRCSGCLADALDTTAADASIVRWVHRRGATAGDSARRRSVVPSAVGARDRNPFNSNGYVIRRIPPEDASDATLPICSRVRQVCRRSWNRTGPSTSGAAVVAVIRMATADSLYVLVSHPVQDSENEVLRHLTVVGGPAGRGAITAGRLGRGRGAWRCAGPVSTPPS